MAKHKSCASMNFSGEHIDGTRAAYAKNMAKTWKLRKGYEAEDDQPVLPERVELIKGLYWAGYESEASEPYTTLDQLMCDHWLADGDLVEVEEEEE